MNVFTYWEGPQPPYITECLRSVRAACRRDCLYRHVTPDNFEHFSLDDVLHPNWRKIPQLGVKSDCVRVAMLYKFGGLYVDADTVMLRSPVGIIDESANCAYSTWTKPPRRVIAGYIYCRPGSDVAAEWLANVNKMLADRRWGWTDLGERCLTPAVDARLNDCQRLPLETFLPVEIDREVQRFLSLGHADDIVTDKTIAIGLNHSWLSAHAPQQLDRKRHHGTLISDCLRLCQQIANRPPLIGVACVTYDRPQLLGKLLNAFERQSYQYRRMVALDDSGRIASSNGDRWEVRGGFQRFSSLGAKRNIVSSMVADMDVDAVVPWDDDDVPLDGALAAVADALRYGDWVRPSLVLTRGGDSLHPTKTHARPDASDKAYHPAWAYTLGVLMGVGGYDESASLGEDLDLALRLRATGVSEADPIACGHSPYLVYAPWGNEHFSWPHKTYEEFGRGSSLPAESPAVVYASEHGLNSLLVARKVMQRPFQTDWWGDKVQ